MQVLKIIIKNEEETAKSKTYQHRSHKKASSYRRRMCDANVKCHNFSNETIFYVKEPVHRKSSWIAMATFPHLFWLPPVEVITIQSGGDGGTANIYWLLFLSWRDCCRCRLLLKVLVLLLMWMDDLCGLWMERRNETVVVSPTTTTDEW